MAENIICELDGDDIDNCPPYANKTSVGVALASICDKLNCYATVAPGQIPENFLTDNWVSIAAMPDATDCPILIITEGANIWMAVNDPVTYDLGTIPATPATGTDWIQL